MRIPVVAIFDIGKTNKKFLLFNRDYDIIYETNEQFPETEDDDGFPCEDLQSLSLWVKQTLKTAFKNKEYQIEAINFSAYGASLVHLDHGGHTVTPLYNYLKPYPENTLGLFFEKNSNKDSISLETASPILGMLNTGLQVFWLKYEKANFFKQIRHTIHLPQYFSYLVTGKPYSEITSFGCHTILWDFKKEYCHNWVYKEKLIYLFPPLVNTSVHEKYTYRDREISCGIGIHDSSAALVPYLLGTEKSFILISTGTWSISFNPFNSEPITNEELKKDCLSYLNFRGRPVKASRVFLGNEHNHQEKRIAAHFGKDDEYHKSVKFDRNIVLKILKEQNSGRKFYPVTMEGTGPLPHKYTHSADLRLFDNFEEAYHQLILDLVAIQSLSLQLIHKNSEVEKFFLSGGFTENEIFVKLLATRFSQIQLHIATIQKSSALGAALVMHNSWNMDKNLQEILGFKICPPEPEINLTNYTL